jgi:hypothetical protein
LINVDEYSIKLDSEEVAGGWKAADVTFGEMPEHPHPA